MAGGLSSPLGIAGLILIIIGIIMAIVGIILLLANQNKPKPWYVWVLLIGGVVLGIAGGIMVAIALSDRREEKHVIVHTTTTPLAPQVQTWTTNPQPVIPTYPQAPPPYPATVLQPQTHTTNVVEQRPSTVMGAATNTTNFVEQRPVMGAATIGTQRPPAMPTTFIQQPATPMGAATTTTNLVAGQ